MYVVLVGLHEGAPLTLLRDPADLLEFCKVALDFTINGGKPQVFARAACTFARSTGRGTTELSTGN